MVARGAKRRPGDSPPLAPVAGALVGVALGAALLGAALLAGGAVITGGVSLVSTASGTLRSDTETTRPLTGDSEEGFYADSR